MRSFIPIVVGLLAAATSSMASAEPNPDPDPAPEPQPEPFPEPFFEHIDLPSLNYPRDDDGNGDGDGGDEAPTLGGRGLGLGGGGGGSKTVSGESLQVVQGFKGKHLKVQPSRTGRMTLEKLCVVPRVVTAGCSKIDKFTRERDFFECLERCYRLCKARALWRADLTSMTLTIYNSPKMARGPRKKALAILRKEYTRRFSYSYDIIGKLWPVLNEPKKPSSPIQQAVAKAIKLVTAIPKKLNDIIKGNKGEPQTKAQWATVKKPKWLKFPY